ncbi:hypothetical protein RB195_005755 [Necator americanus]|uniref:Zinc finger PHD-type domain-containing protein n=1 Tax=Necator americanus TaxID=51031 RepID=A0ABR1BQY3_NECAM
MGTGGSIIKVTHCGSGWRRIYFLRTSNLPGLDNVAMNECPVCGAARSRMERHLVDVNGFSQDQIAEYKAQKKSRRISASGKPIHNCDYCDATFNSEYASVRESLFKVMRNPTAATRMGLEQAESKLKEFRKMIDDLAGNVEESENNVRLARRPEVPPVGRPQTLTPIRKLHKRAHLRKEEQAKRKPTLDIPDCAQDERDACACPTCEDWMHTECINNVCPRDGTDLERNDV